MIDGSAAPTSHARSDSPAESVRAAFRGFRALGMSESEAGNLSALVAGLGRARTGWRLGEIERLLFIRSLADSGRID